MRLPQISLTEKEIDRLSNILNDVGTVTAVTAVLPSILSSFNLSLVIEGGIISLIFWVLSIKTTKLWTQ